MVHVAVFGFVICRCSERTKKPTMLMFCKFLSLEIVRWRS